jgi:hypothetical protein
MVMAEIQGLSHVTAGLAGCDKAFKKKDFKRAQICSKYQISS